MSISSPTLDWETRGFKVNEAPAVIVRNGRVFITYSASATDANYCMGLLSASADAELVKRKLLDEIAAAGLRDEREEPSNTDPATTASSIARGRQDGSLVYHARNYAKITGDPLNDPNRHTRVQPFTWNPDGSPDFGEPVADGPMQLTAGNESRGPCPHASIRPIPYGQRAQSFRLESHAASPYSRRSPLRILPRLT